MKVEIYLKMSEVHTSKDKKVGWPELEKIEKESNRHSYAFKRMLNLGKNHGQEDRYTEAINSVDNVPPPTYYLVKDHKPRDENNLYRTRPVCGAEEGPLQRLQMLIHMVLAAFVNCREEKYSCASTEEML